MNFRATATAKSAWIVVRWPAMGRVTSAVLALVVAALAIFMWPVPFMASNSAPPPLPAFLARRARDRRIQCTRVARPARPLRRSVGVHVRHHLATLRFRCSTAHDSASDKSLMDYALAASAHCQIQAWAASGSQYSIMGSPILSITGTAHFTSNTFAKMILKIFCTRAGTSCTRERSARRGARTTPAH